MWCHTLPPLLCDLGLFDVFVDVEQLVNRNLICFGTQKTVMKDSKITFVSIGTEDM